MTFEKCHLWPRGDFTMITDLSYIKLGPTAVNTFQLALQFISYHGYFNGSLQISFSDWYHLAINKMILNDDIAILFFITAKHLEQINDMRKDVISAEQLRYTILHKDDNPDGKNRNYLVQIMPLALVISMAGCNHEETGFDTKFPSYRNAFDFISRNLKKFCSILLLCDKLLMKQLVTSANVAVECIPPPTRIHVDQLANLNIAFEGVILPLLNKINERNITPDGSWSVLKKKIICTYQSTEIRFDDLVCLISNLLQPDMFGIHDLPTTNGSTNGCNSKQPSYEKRFTPCCLAKYRKLAVFGWNHLETFISPLYGGLNFKICNGHSKSSYLFFPQYSKTVNISNTNGCNPILLGPVIDTVFLSNVHHCSISVIAHKIVMRNCTNLRLFICVSTPPVINSDCFNIQFGPYNFFYSALENQLAYANMKLLDISQNQWRHPIVCSELFPPTYYKTELTKIHGIFKPLAPSSFYIQPNIFDMNFKTSFFQFFRIRTIPYIYMKSWEQSLDKMRRSDWKASDKKMLSDADIRYLLKKSA
uniref:C-CAP/cofactor C-like domain-containing protein n=1 Tax=Rhabditophanes sp. KR3021 TaxID=114890 RepID=A0AC35TVD7_9BILA